MATIKHYQALMNLINKTCGTRYEMGSKGRPAREDARLLYSSLNMDAVMERISPEQVKEACKGAGTKALLKLLNAIYEKGETSSCAYTESVANRGQKEEEEKQEEQQEQETEEEATEEKTEEPREEKQEQEKAEEPREEQTGEEGGEPVTPEIQEEQEQEKQEKQEKKEEQEEQQEEQEATEEKKPEEKQKQETIRHEKTDAVEICIKAGIPVYLYGPAGTGKTEIARTVSIDLNLDFYTMSKVQSAYDLSGFIDAHGKYQATEFYRAFTQGGIFLLDELDASAPDAVIALNSAIANGFYSFPTGRETAHPDFHVIATGNTSGYGADSTYTGREAVDGATLDRFAVITIDYDVRIERICASGDDSLVSFIHAYRKACADACIEVPVSYRGIKNIAKLVKAGLRKEEAILYALIKGMDKETARSIPLVSEDGNEWFDAYRKATRRIA